MAACQAYLQDLMLKVYCAVPKTLHVASTWLTKLGTKMPTFIREKQIFWQVKLHALCNFQVLVN